MKIILSPGEDVTDTFIEMVTILNNMRHWQKEWGEHYGHELLKRKHLWEGRADKLLQRLGSTEHIEHNEKVFIEHKTNQKT